MKIKVEKELRVYGRELVVAWVVSKDYGEGYEKSGETVEILYGDDASSEYDRYHGVGASEKITSVSRSSKIVETNEYEDMAHFIKAGWMDEVEKIAQRN